MRAFDVLSGDVSREEEDRSRDEEKYPGQYHARIYKRLECSPRHVRAATCVTIIMVRGAFSVFQPEIVSTFTPPLASSRAGYESRDFLPLYNASA